MWPHSHFLAAYVKAEAPSTRWTAEFSDPLLWHVDGSARTSDAVRADPISRRLFGGLSPAFQRELGASPGVLRAAQLLPFALADELVFTNVQQREVMVGDLGDTELRRQVLARSIVSPHPTPPAEWYAGVPSVHPPRDRISIGYFGTFYANRGLGVMIEALRSLPREQRNRFSVHIFSAGSAAVRAAAERAGIGQLVSAHDELPYLRFLQAAKAFDYLLVQDTQTGGFPVANPFLPSKLSDYKGTGARIFALVAPGSEMAAMSFPAKAVVGDVGSVRSALLRMTESATVDRAEGKGATHAC
ncbi:MAG TPA: hypothetical protein VFJ94_01165 [Intrasporangium sp.]|uniref:hypothetical protein n=1 Tax=Intrasporangium sp. TaxID=1925024 RepID=UPI002D779E2D|nr:hypothetical protein [Intrasporangium sp.]HET7397101.1 hypothetical protein [Intrasporangium sp.]